MKKAIAVFVVCCVVAAFADNPHVTQLIELIDVAISSPSDGDVLTFGASTGKWSNKQPATTVFPDTGRVVLRYQQENIEGNFPLTTFFSPSENGLYRVSLIVATTPRISDQDPCASSVNGGGVVTIDYNGSLFNRLPNAAFSGNGSQAEASGLIKADSGSPFRVMSSQTGSGCPYSLYIVVEKL